MAREYPRHLPLTALLIGQRLRLEALIQHDRVHGAPLLALEARVGLAGGLHLAQWPALNDNG